MVVFIEGFYCMITPVQLSHLILDQIQILDGCPASDTVMHTLSVHLVIVVQIISYHTEEAYTVIIFGGINHLCTNLENYDQE